MKRQPPILENWRMFTPKVQEVSNLPKTTCEQIYSRYFYELSRAARKNQYTSMRIHGVGSIIINFHTLWKKYLELIKIKYYYAPWEFKRMVAERQYKRVKDLYHKYLNQFMKNGNIKTYISDNTRLLEPYGTKDKDRDDSQKTEGFVYRMPKLPKSKFNSEDKTVQDL